VFEALWWYSSLTRLLVVINVCQQVMTCRCAELTESVHLRCQLLCRFLGSATIIVGTCWPRSGSIYADRYAFSFVLTTIMNWQITPSNQLSRHSVRAHNSSIQETGQSEIAVDFRSGPTPKRFSVSRFITVTPRRQGSAGFV
jgi:hypothetical protein